MGWEKEMSKVNFTGNQISVKDLKEKIIEARNLQSGKPDFVMDLKISDDATKQGIFLAIDDIHKVFN